MDFLQRVRARRSWWVLALLECNWLNAAAAAAAAATQTDVSSVGIVNGTFAAASTPLARPQPSEYVVPADAEKVFEVKGRIEVADGAELNWPIAVAESFTVADVRLTLRGLYHEDARDVKIELLHADERVTVVDVPASDRRTNCPFGSPPTGDFSPRGSYLSGGFATGVDLYFSDGNASTRFAADPSVNLAVGRPAYQSTTASVVPSQQAAAYETYDASFAVDGHVDGTLSDITVAMTADGTSSHNGIGDGNPWWEVDLETTQEIGSVWVWGRSPAPVGVRPEVQRVTVDAGEWFEDWVDGTYESTDGNTNWFTLQFTGPRGVTYETRGIAVDAPACGVDGCGFEDLEKTSVQYALQELPNVRKVTVTRQEVRGAYGHHSSVQRLLGYAWDISFTNPAGNLHALKIGSAFNLTNTESNAQLGNASTVVSVAIRQHGLVRPQSTSVASFETGSNQTSTPVSGTNPAERAWVMVFDDDPALLADRLSVDSVATVSSLTYTDQNGSAFHRAKKSAAWAQVFEYSALQGFEGGQLKFAVPEGVVGRYVRVQAESVGGKITLAEVQVFGASFRPNDLDACARGKQIESDEYTPMQSLSAAFAGHHSHGDWILRISDLMTFDPSQRRIPFYGTEPLGREHGTGFLSDWVIQIIDTTGLVHYYYTDLEFQLVAVPACGRIFAWNGETSDIDVEILAVDGAQRSINKCDTDHKEYVEAVDNVFSSRTKLLYVPREGYIGDDLLRVRAQIHNTGAHGIVAPDASGASDFAEVHLHVRSCRVRQCEVPVETLECTNDFVPEGCDVSEEFAPAYWVDPGFLSPTSYADYGASVHLEDYQSQSRYADRSIHELEEVDTWYDSLGQGHCSDTNVKNHGDSQLEFCYYAEGYATEDSCAQLCTTDQHCAGYTRGKEGKRSSFDFNGWCITYTTAACSEWGEKANKGVGVHITGSKHNPMYGDCMVKRTGAVEFSRCWKREPGFCDDALTLVSWTLSMEECQDHCAQISASTEPLCTWSAEPNASTYLPGLTTDDGYVYSSLIEAKVACQSMYLRGEDMEGCNGITYFNGGYQTRRGNYLRQSTLTGQTEKSWLVSCTTSCEGVMYTSNGYCYSYESTRSKAECLDWYATGDGDDDRHAFAFARSHPAEATSYFIGPCDGIATNGIAPHE